MVALLSAQALLSRRALSTNRIILKKSSITKAGGKLEMEVLASLDWKPNGHTGPGPGIEPVLNGPQQRGSTATLPVPLKYFSSG